MPDSVVFRPDLYHGTASDYDRFRQSYPDVMVNDLLARTKPSGQGRLLDLACGTGQITFAMLDRFEEVWAVDQEEDMVEVVREKLAARGMGRVRAIVSAAEDLEAPEASFELVAIGNAFHRFRREVVTSKVFRCLAPGGYLALLWASSPWNGNKDWQGAMSAVLETWKTRTGAVDRIPEGWDKLRRERPDATVIKETGFELSVSYRFPTRRNWTIEALIGFVYSTSFLPRRALGGNAKVFEADLRRELNPYERTAGLPETIDFTYELARRPS